MYYKRECPQCGKIFRTKVPNKKFCGKSCRSEAMSKLETTKNKGKGQLCWDCKNCTGYCSWSHDFTPVEGWTAKPVKKREAGRIIETYHITACPQFVEG